MDVANIDTVLQNMEMKFTDTEMEELLEKLPVDGECVHLIVPVRHIGERVLVYHELWKRVLPLR